MSAPHVFDEPFNPEMDSHGRQAEFLRRLASAYRETYAAGLAIVGNRNDADDVIQEVCIVLWQKYDEFEDGTDFRRWACSVAFNVAKNFSRKQRRVRSFGLSDHALARIEQVRAGGTELFELRREVLHNCISKLSERDQQFLEDCYGSSLSLVAFARSQGTPIETIYTRLKRLRRRLSDCINRTLGNG